MAQAVPAPSQAMARRLPRRHWVLGALFVATLGAAIAASYTIDDMLRGQIEARLNSNLQGYTARLPGVHLHLLGFALTLEELRISQTQHPNPPVGEFPTLTIGVEWRSLLHGRLVADVNIDRPKLHINQMQLSAEASDKIDLKDKGWQQAIESIYPLKINSLVVRNGEVTYIDDDPKRPLTIQRLNLEADNVRNVRLPDDVYPSGVHLDATIFNSGQVHVDGRANFLAEPHAAIDADMMLEHVPLDALKPVVADANLRLSGGILGAAGHVEYTPKKQVTHLKKLTIDGINIEYEHRRDTAAAEAQRLETAKEVAKDLSNEPETVIKVDEVLIDNSTLGYRDETKPPGYRLFLSNAAVKVQNFNSQATKEPATALVKGQFMGTGSTVITSTLRPVHKQPDFDLRVQIDGTELRGLNDLFRTYGNFDVNTGRFAFYSELRAHDGELRGYIKPLFTNMDVYARTQDRDKPVLNQVYEGIVGGLADLLQNSDDDVATKADVSGRIDEPNVSTWEVVIRLVQNAFIKAITPGFDRVRAAHSQSAS